MTPLAFLTEPPPPRGEAFSVAPGIRRLVANNPGKFTYHGTNTYLIEGAGGLTVLDPGPDDATHVATILRAAGAPVARIFLTHGHRDHSGAVAALVAATGAKLIAFGQGMADGDRVGIWTVLHTPGHAADHVCFAREDGVVLTGDHVMGFATSVVIPPDGDMAAYMKSLDRMLARKDVLYLPGHGPPIPDPHPFVRALGDHRLQREAAILAALHDAALGPSMLVARLYPGLDPGLHEAAAASVTAHLLKLHAEGRAAPDGGGWRAIP